MMRSNYDNLQYVFACISTHSKWVKIIKDDFCKVSKCFKLSSNDETILRNFFINSSRQIWVSAILSEEKRWREVLPSIRYSAEIVGLNILKSHWNRYLECFMLTERIPTSPILESINFLKFLSKQHFISLIKEVFEYESVRNSVLDFNFDLSDNAADKANIEIIKENLYTYKAIINPSLISKVFNCSISKIIEALQQGFNKLIPHVKAIERVSFYKLNKSNIIKSIHLSELSHSCLLKLNDSKNISDWIKDIINISNATQKSCISFLEKMYKLGVILIIKSE